MKMEPTIRDIAKKCGVGVSTVSRAINNHPDINQKTKEIIMRTIKEMNYVPNNSARNLKRIESKTIAVLVKGNINHLFDSIIREMEKEINQTKYSFFLQHVEEHQDETDVALHLIKEKRLRGIIFLGGFYDKNESKLGQITVPFVLSTVGAREHLEECTYSYFAVDDFHESYKMTDYLCKQGHNKIAILAAPLHDSSIGKLRLKGYIKALRDNEIPLSKDLICYMEEGIPTYSMESGYQMMEKLLDTGVEFTAVYAISDMQAIGACKAIFRRGKKIPQDYSVAGFDGLADTYYYEPSITTIQQPVKEIGKASISALFEMIKTKKSVPGKVYSGELLVRESTRSVHGE